MTQEVWLKTVLMSCIKMTKEYFGLALSKKEFPTTTKILFALGYTRIRLLTRIVFHLTMSTVSLKIKRKIYGLEQTEGASFILTAVIIRSHNSYTTQKMKTA